MAIVFIDFNAVEVDGVNAGDIVSVLSNYPTRKAEVLKAFRDFRSAEKDARDDKVTKAEADLAAEKTARQTERDVAREEKRVAVQAAQDALKADMDRIKDEKRVTYDELNTLKQELGGDEVVKAKLREERRKAIQEAKAKAIAEQAALEAEESALD